MLGPADATANLPAHSLVEKATRSSTGSADMPITVAPAALNLSIFPANSRASAEQPGVKASGKKSRTNGPRFHWCDRVKVQVLPYRASRGGKYGAVGPHDGRASLHPAAR